MLISKKCRLFNNIERTKVENIFLSLPSKKVAFRLVTADISKPF